MALKIPQMQFDKRINKEEGRKLLDFADKYITVFQDNMVERALNNVISSSFLGKGQYEILMKRRDNFSDDEVDDPEFFYIQKYKPVVSKLLAVTQTTGIGDPKLKDMLDFFTRQGYLTKKQIGLIHFLTKKYSSIIAAFNSSTHPELENILHHHIKKDFMKVTMATEVAEILTGMREKKEKEVKPKKKLFFSLSQIRNELSS